MSPGAAAGRPLLEVRGLKKHFPLRTGLLSRVTGWVKAVDGISFEIQEGETLGLVGESGSGKTTAGRAILRLLEPTAGSVLFQGTDLEKLNAGRLRQTRRSMQVIFQDPYSSLNPRMTVEAIVGEGLLVHGLGSRRERREKVREALLQVGLDSSYLQRYPHEFSGGQRQRIGIARALALEPRFIVCDEPVSALDVSIQSQIINLLVELRERHRLTYLFIAHDLSLVEYLSDRVAVMYLGKIVETATAQGLYRNPLHPYTRALLSAVPSADPLKRRERTVLSGEVGSPLNPPSGCRFHPRCPLVRDICRTVEPRELDLAGHKVSCHAVEEEIAGKSS
jgi:oligopeptide transport system ATP-binding protein